MFSHENSALAGFAWIRWAMALACLLVLPASAFAQTTVTKETKVKISLTMKIESGDMQVACPDSMLVDSLKIKVVNKNDVGVKDAEVEFTITNTPAGAAGQAVSSMTVKTNAQGEAAVKFTVGDKTGEYEITATAKDDEVEMGSPQKFKAFGVTVMFARAGNETANGNAFGFDELGTAADPTDDHISVKKNGTTFVNVTLQGVTDATDLFFTSSDDTIVKAEKPGATPAAGFLLKVLGQNKDKAEAKIEARAGSETGPICATIAVNVFKEVALSGDYFQVFLTGKKAATLPAAVAANDVVNVANPFLKPSIVTVALTAPQEKGIAFDLNGNDKVDVYFNGDNDELDAIYTALTADGVTSADVVLLKESFPINWFISASVSVGDTKITVPGTQSLATVTQGGSYALMKPDGTDKEPFTITSINGNELTIDTDPTTAGNQGFTKAHPLTADPMTSHTIVDQTGTAGGVGADPDANRPALVVGATAAEIGYILAHEQTHALGLSDVNLGGNLMHFSTAFAVDPKLSLRFLELVQVETGTSIPKPGSPKDNQWNDVTR